MTTLTARNDFHGTEVEVKISGFYEAVSGEQIAIVDAKNMNVLDNLCGMDDCCCGGCGDTLIDEDGNSYFFKVNYE